MTELINTTVDAADDSATALVKRVHQMTTTLNVDRWHYDHLHEFATGAQMDVRIPAGVDQTVRDIAGRAVANFLPLAISVPAQLSFVDGYYRMSEDEDELLTSPPEWQVWNRSGFRARQTTLFKTALKYGVAYLALDDIDTDEPRLKLLSTRNTMAYFRDPVNDLTPTYAITILPSQMVDEPDVVIYYDESVIVRLEKRGANYTIVDEYEHGLGSCPVVRYPCYIDDEGNTSGVVEQLEVPQSRINQTVFDLLLTQTFSSARVRYAAGLQGDPVLDADGLPLKDENGFTIFKPMPVDQSRILLTDNPDAKFGTLEETPLQGFIDSFDSAVKTLAVLGSIPPHSLLGSMANLSGETISAAMGQTSRHTHMLKTAWAESIKETMRLVRLALGETAGDDYDDEVRWRDMSDASMSQIADALGKLATNLQIPVEGLWPRVPGATDAEVLKWRLQKRDIDELTAEDALDVEAAAERESLDVFGSVEPETAISTDADTSNLSIQGA